MNSKKKNTEDAQCETLLNWVACEFETSISILSSVSQSTRRLRDRYYRFKIGNIMFQTNFAPLIDMGDMSKLIIYTFPNRDAYETWYNNVRPTIQERYSYFTKGLDLGGPEISKHIKTLCLPCFSDQQKQPKTKTLYSHYCISCNKYISVYRSKSSGYLKQTNAKLHIENCHSNSVKESRDDGGSESDHGPVQSSAKSPEQVSTSFTSPCDATPLSAMKLRIARAMVLQSNGLSLHAAFSNAMLGINNPDGSYHGEVECAADERLSQSIMREMFFVSFIIIIRNFVNSCRNYYIKLGLENHSFMCLSFEFISIHPLPVLGFFVTFMDPVNGEMERITIGLTTEKDEKKLSQILKERLEMFDVQPEDIAFISLACNLSRVLSSNDVFTSVCRNAITVVCPSSIANELIYHALEIESFKKLDPVAKYMDEVIVKVSGSMSAYKQFVEASKGFESSVKFPSRRSESWPLTTLVTAQSMITARHSLNRFDERIVNDPRFRYIVEAEGILKPVASFLDDLVQNELPTAGHALLMKAFLNLELQADSTMVVDQCQPVYPSTTALNKLKRVPFTIDKRDSSKAHFSDRAIALKKKLQKMFVDKHCMENPLELRASKEELLVMILDPVFVTVTRELKDMDHEMGKELQRLWDLAQETLIEEYSKELSHTNTSNRYSAVSRVDELISQGCSLKDALLKSGSVTFQNSKMSVYPEIIAWLSMPVPDWTGYCEKDCVKQEFLELSNRFDTYKYVNGFKYFADPKIREKFPVIHRMAMKYAVLPVSHGFEYETLSLCSGLLRTQFDDCFNLESEMYALEFANSNWVQGKMGNTQQLLQFFVDNKKDLIEVSSIYGLPLSVLDMGKSDSYSRCTAVTDLINECSAILDNMALAQSDKTIAKLQNKTKRRKI